MTAGDLNHWGGLALLAMIWVAVLIGASIPIVLLARTSYRFLIGTLGEMRGKIAPPVKADKRDVEINRLMEQELGR